MTSLIFYGVEFTKDLSPSEVKYTYFGLTRESTKDQIKSKYRELILKHHPDKNKSADTTTKMAEINKAYDFIMMSIAHSTVS